MPFDRSSGTLPACDPRASGSLYGLDHLLPGISVTDDRRIRAWAVDSQRRDARLAEFLELVPARVRLGGDVRHQRKHIGLAEFGDHWFAVQHAAVEAIAGDAPGRGEVHDHNLVVRAGPIEHCLAV